MMNASLISQELFSERIANGGLAADKDLELLKREAEHGFAFFECYDETKSSNHGIDSRTFGQAYISPQYIRSTWGEFGDILEIGPAVAGWQDLAVLRKQ